MYRLVFLSGRYEGKRLVVRQAVTLVGHDAECHLLLPDDPLLAPRHARFEERGTGVYLSSLAADRPVERNGQPVGDTIRLAHNDLLVLGQTRIQFQDIIAPHARLRPSPGLLQPLTLLVAAAILGLELALLVFLVDWQPRIIRPDTEAADIAFAEKNRAARAAEKSLESGTTSTSAAPVSVVTLPGTESGANGKTPQQPKSSPPGAATSSTPSAIRVLDEADFVPADTNTVVAALPPISAADPAIGEAQRMLAEAASAAQFADYAQAFRILNQIHQNLPGFIPAHVEHGRLLETRGDLDAAQQRWTQILGLAPEGSPFRRQALAERQRLATLQSLQTEILRTPGTPDPSALPRHIRILEPEMQKMPSDAEIAEMRVLNATLELASGAPLFKDAAIQVFVTFYDADTNTQVHVSRVITTPSPVLLGNAFANRRSLPFDATYVVPRGLQANRHASYYGYTLHVFAGQILQDADAKPKKLLERPIHFPAPAATP
jgi:tetratricopeptide (TPR) repeat protein